MYVVLMTVRVLFQNRFLKSTRCNTMYLHHIWLKKFTISLTYLHLLAWSQLHVGKVIKKTFLNRILEPDVYHFFFVMLEVMQKISDNLFPFLYLKKNAWYIENSADYHQDYHLSLKYCQVSNKNMILIAMIWEVSKCYVFLRIIFIDLYYLRV